MPAVLANRVREGGGLLLIIHDLALPGGQRQRVATARTLAGVPDLIVCDEPVSALDIGISAQIPDLLADLQGRLGTALLFISHDWGFIPHTADRVLVFRGGRIIDQGHVTDVSGVDSLAGPGRRVVA